MNLPLSNFHYRSVLSHQRILYISMFVGGGPLFIFVSGYKVTTICLSWATIPLSTTKYENWEHSTFIHLKLVPKSQSIGGYMCHLL